MSHGTHHWIITLQAPEGPGVAVATYSGTTTPPRGATRADAYASLRADIAAQDRRMANANCLFFSFEDNEL
ncbi:hypothetical protein [Streptomyces youssoufiensis]